MSGAAGPGAGTDLGLVRATEHVLRPDPRRVVATRFLAGEDLPAVEGSRAAAVLARVLAMPEEVVEAELAHLEALFVGRHRDLRDTWDAHAAIVLSGVSPGTTPSAARRRLVGATFTQEYAIEGAALTNPSMSPHPDQSGLPAGSTRFVLTLRAVGEGHVSSVELRTGTIDAHDVVVLDPAPAVAVLAAVTSPSPTSPSPTSPSSTRPGPTTASTAEASAVVVPVPAAAPVPETYSVAFPPASAVAERVLMPHAPAESHGMEDLRFTRIEHLDGATEHVGTYTAYDGEAIGIRLLRTDDLERWTSEPLTGPGAQNKGLALFPRPIDGRYVALSRADRESNAVTTSRDLLRWDEPVRVQRPGEPWEVVQLGNCGPPLETEEGWLVLTHGVGPMRTYTLGALLLDLHAPTVVRGRLRTPLLAPAQDERDGYVPNVAYTCGAMLHGRTVVLPYGCSDAFTRIALVDLDALLARMLVRS